MSMKVTDYITAIEEFVPQLEELGFTIGDYNCDLPVISLRGFGISTYVQMDDLQELEYWTDPEEHAKLLEAIEKEGALNE